MIVLDTSMLRNLRLTGDATLVALRTLAQRAGHELAIPEMVLHEYLSSRGRDLTNALSTAESAIGKVLAMSGPWENREDWEGLQGPEPDAVVAATQE